MLRGSIFITLLLAYTVSLYADGNVYSTKRLSEIAGLLSLPRLDTLARGRSTQAYLYKEHPLSIRRGLSGEIEHIGLFLFNDEFRRQSASPVYDFLERELLELNLEGRSEERTFRSENEKITFVTGNARTPFSFDGTESFSEERIDMKAYRITWEREGKTLLRISFDMDIELLAGAGAPELEERFVRHLDQYSGGIVVPPAIIFPEHGRSFSTPGNSFLIDEMRNGLYYEHDERGWHLVSSEKKPTWAISNLMLAGALEDTPLLHLTIDKYGYASDTLTVPYNRLIAMCRADGCIPYFAHKGQTAEGEHTGTLLLVNRSSGYVHMLLVRIPAATLASRGGGAISGRIYLYIPMHNVSDQYFNFTNINK